VFTDFYLEDYKRAWEASGQNIDIFLVVTDLGTQRGPLISVDMFDKFVAPYLAELAELIHGFGAKFMFHSCGGVSQFIPSMIKNCKIDILNPIQPTGSEEMTPESLKQFTESGGICFHGGMDVQRLMPFCSPCEIKRAAKYYAETFGSRYILCPAHLFQPDTPPENIIALYQAFG
jgi:uroporphyrinogen decarboxylase